MATETSATPGSTGFDASLRNGAIVGGILLALLGILAMFAPFVTGVTLAVLLGAALVVGSLLHVASAFSANSLGGAIWQVLLGIFYAIAGISLVANPVLGLATLTILVVAFLLVSGLVQLGWAFLGGAGSRLWFAASGGISLLLAAMLWAGFPSTALWAVGVLFGANLLLTGVAMIVHGRSGTVTAAPDSMGAGQHGTS